MKGIVIIMTLKTSTGQKVVVSGQYKPHGSNNEVTFVQGNKVPPYGKTTSFTLVDKTKHKK